MKHLFFFVFIAHSMSYVYAADQSKQQSILTTATKVLDEVWNKDTGKLSEDYLKTEHQKQQARENIFHTDLSSLDRRDLRRAIIVLGLSSGFGAVAMPQLAVPIFAYGGICMASLSLHLLVCKSPDDSKHKKGE